MKIERTRNTIKGTIFGVILRLVNIIFPFIIRTIFIHLLGAEYLGLNSLFTSVLQVLNLAELGVGSALVFSMYKPIIDDDVAHICSLMKLYRYFYRVIGMVILILGVVIIPLIPYMIKGDIPSDINIYVIYLMHLATTVLSYWLFSYRICLFQAFQRTDIVSVIGILISICLYTSQIASLIIWKNYYLFLLISVLFQAISNILTALISKRVFPDFRPEGSVDEEEIRDIKIRVKSLFTAKIGSVVAQSCDTIVISAFLGLTTLAVYQNYYYIFSAVYAMVMVFFVSAQAGIGNYLLIHSDKDKEYLLSLFNYITAFIAVIVCCCLINLYQPFVAMCFGEKYLLEYPHVVFLAIYFYTYMVLRPFCVFKDSAGMWEQDRFRPLASASLNLVLNVATVRIFGLYGVIGSTIIAVVFVSIPWVVVNINKYMFSLNIKKMFIREIGYIAAGIVCCIVTYGLSHQLTFDNIYVSLIIKLLISLIVPIIVFEIIYYKTSENKYIITNGLGFLRGRI